MPAMDEKKRPNRCVLCSRKALNGFCQLSEPALRILGDSGTSVTLRGRMPLFVQGSPVQSVYVVCSGRIKLFSNSPAGRTVITRFVGPGAILGSGELIGQGEAATFQASAEAMPSAEVRAIPVAVFRQMARDYPEVEVRLGQQLARECESAYRRIRLLGLGRSVLERVAGYLLEDSQEGLLAPRTQEEVAQELGLSRESVCRALAQFKTAGAIRIQRGRWTITDRGALEEFSRNPVVGAA